MPRIYEAPIYTEEQIQVMEEEQIIFPYSTKYMIYDSLKRQYIPTMQLLLKHGVYLEEFLSTTGDNTPHNVQEELEYISDQVYAYIYKNSGSNIETLKFIIAKGIKRGMSPYRFRLLFEEILWKQARFYINNDDPSKSVGIDIEQKQWLNKGVLNNEDRHIDPKVKAMLMSLGLTWLGGSYDGMFGNIENRKDW